MVCTRQMPALYYSKLKAQEANKYCTSLVCNSHGLVCKAFLPLRCYLLLLLLLLWHSLLWLLWLLRPLWLVMLHA